MLEIWDVFKTLKEEVLAAARCGGEFSVTHMDLGSRGMVAVDGRVFPLIIR